jgi:hypothetical protein
MQKVVSIGAIALFAPVALAACSRDATVYPSLAVRPAEARGFAEPAAPPPEPVRADPALDAAIAKIAARLATVKSSFDADAARADRAAKAARGRAAGSEAWLTAQTALAMLDDWRAQASALASEAGDLASARAATLAAPYPALDSLQAALTAEVARQDAEIDRIQAALPAA